MACRAGARGRVSPPSPKRASFGAAAFVAARAKAGGARRDRTDDLMLAKHALYQLSYGPLGSWSVQKAGLPSRSSRPLAPAFASGLRRGSLLSLRERRLVGPGRLELPTLRLSGVRSNHLSYGPRAGLPSRSSRPRLPAFAQAGFGVAAFVAARAKAGARWARDRARAPSAAPGEVERETETATSRTQE